MIEIQNLYKSYGSLEVLKDISFKIEKGDIFGIIGQSGAWKCDRAYKAVSDGESDPAGCEASSEVRRLCDAGDCGRKGLRRPYECRSETDDLRG